LNRALLSALALGLCLTGCTDWLAIAEPPPGLGLELDEAEMEFEGLPKQPGRVDSKGTLIPRTPGLRVPGGYVTHARLDNADFLLEHTWAAFDLTRSPGSQPTPRMMLRLVATGAVVGAAHTDAPSVRAVFPLALPKGTLVDGLAGLTIREEGLSEARVGIRTSTQHHWIVEPTRLSIEQVTAEAIKGSFEGPARRGLKSDRVRTLRVGFIALRAPTR
jgi:hypothetical protein